MERPKAAVVVLNWNRPEETIRCLGSLRQLTYRPIDVIVVDNGSTDGSVAAVRAAHPTVHVVQTGHNLGYAGGNNVGAREALRRGAEFVLLLNNDTVVSSPDLVELLLAAAAQFPHCGLVGPAMVPLDAPDSPAPSPAPTRLGRLLERRVFSRLPGVAAGRQVEQAVSQAEPSGTRVMPSLTGFALGIFRPTFEDVGFFDERYFLYDEEHDLCLRAGQRGYCCLWVPAARVLRALDAKERRVPAYKAYYLARNRFFTARRFAVSQRLVLLFVHALSMVDLAVHLAVTRQGRSIPFLLHGFAHGLIGRGGSLVAPS